MASTPFYEDRGVGAVDVDCGADLDSDTNINGVASFRRWTEWPLEQLDNAWDKRVPRNIGIWQLEDI